jgi:hypothetical protein
MKRNIEISNIYFIYWNENLKVINYLTNTCQSCQCVIILHIVLAIHSR